MSLGKVLPLRNPKFSGQRLSVLRSKTLKYEFFVIGEISSFFRFFEI